MVVNQTDLLWIVKQLCWWTLHAQNRNHRAAQIKKNSDQSLARSSLNVSSKAWVTSKHQLVLNTLKINACIRLILGSFGSTMQPLIKEKHLWKHSQSWHYKEQKPDACKQKYQSKYYSNDLQVTKASKMQTLTTDPAPIRMFCGFISR